MNSDPLSFREELADALEGALRKAARAAVDPVRFLHEVNSDFAALLTSDQIPRRDQFQQIEIRALIAVTLAEVIPRLLVEFSEG